MNIQIIGTLKCSDTQKALRFFKERKIQVHLHDLNEKALTAGELENITRKISVDDLLNRDGKQYAKRQLQFMVFNITDELLNDPLLIKTPIVRNGKESTIGCQPDVWKSWIAAG